MIGYGLLPLSFIEKVYEKVEKYLPDVLRSPGAFASMCVSRDTAVFEVGTFGGVFWLSNIVVGWKATGHVVLWDKECLRQYKAAQHIIKEIFRLFRLQRLDAYIPADNEKACHYAEHLGFTMEGILRKFEVYDGEYRDVAVYSLMKEDL